MATHDDTRDANPVPERARLPAEHPLPVPDDLERILEVPLAVHVELGGKRMRVRDLLEIGAGAVIELDTLAGAPLGVYANSTLIAQGEAVVVGERYGIRVTEIFSPAERVRRLGSGVPS